MKSFNYYKLKAIGQKLAILSIASLVLVSCGKSNKKNEANNNTGISGNSPLIGNNAQGSWNQLKSQTQCQGVGQGFTSNGRLGDLGYTYNQQSGQFTQGGAASQSGVVAFGKSSAGDLIYMSPINSNGYSTTYAVVISLCSQQGQQNGEYLNNIQNMQPGSYGLYPSNQNFGSNGEVNGSIRFMSTISGGYYNGQSINNEINFTGASINGGGGGCAPYGQGYCY